MRTQIDLAWYYQQAHADCGVASSWGPMSDLALSGPSTTSQPEDRMTDRALRAAGRHRRIRNKLARLTQRHQQIIAILYGYHRLNPETLPLGPLAQYTLAARDAYEATTKEASIETWLTAAVRRSDPVIAQIQQQVITLTNEAHAAYEQDR